MFTLSQAFLDRMAVTTFAALAGVLETVTYRARTTASATPVDHAGLVAHVEQYSDHAVAMQGLISGERPTVLREDRRVRLQTALVTWTPTLNDEVLRVGGSHWRVLSISGGPGQPFYLFQCRRIPTP